MRLLSNEDVAEVLTMEACMEALEEGFAELARGRAVNNPRVDTLCSTSPDQAAGQLGLTADELFRQLPLDELGPAVREAPCWYYGFKTMVGMVPSMGVVVLRLNSDVIAYPTVGGVPRRVKVPVATGLHYCGLVLLFSTRNGEPLAIMPDGYLQAMRVGGTGGLGTKYLSRPDARVLALIGSGWQARAALLANAVARRLERVRVYSTDPERRARFARAMRELTGLDVQPVDSVAEALAGSDIVACATNSTSPLFPPELLEAGMHVSNVNEHELTPAHFARADVLVITWHRQGGFLQEYVVPADADRVAPPGVRRAAHPGDGIDGQGVAELGEVIVGARPGRRRDADLTMHRNCSAGIQFAAVAARVYALARARGLGREWPTRWFTQSLHP